MRDLRKARLASLFISAVIVSGVCSANPELRAPRRAPTVDDIMRMEDVGAAVADPTGRRIVYDRYPPYAQRPDFGAEWLRTEAVGGVPMLIDLASSAAAKPLFAVEPGASYSVLNFSPNGDAVALLKVMQGQVSVAVFDFALDRLVTFPCAPYIRQLGDPIAIWTGNDSLIFAALPDGEQPERISMRRQATEWIRSARERSWAGKEPSFREVVSTAAPLSEPLEGALMLANVRTSAVTVLAEGLYTDIQVAPGGRFVAALKEFRLGQKDPDKPRTDWLATQHQLWLFELPAGSAKIVEDGLDVFPDSMDWSADGRRLAFFAWTRDTPVEAGVYHALDATTGRVVPWIHRGLDLASQRERAQVQQPERAVWLGNRLAVVARELPARNAQPQFTYREYVDSRAPRADWVLLDSDGTWVNLTAKFKAVSPVPVSAYADSLYILADGDMWRIDQSGKRTNLTRTFAAPLVPLARNMLTALQARSSPAVALTSDRLDSNDIVFLHLNAPGADLEVVPVDSAVTRTMTVAPGVSAALLRTVGDEGSVLTLRRTGSRDTVVDRLNPFLADVEIPRWQVLRHRASADGRELKSCMLLPYGYRPGHRYPVVMEIYPHAGTRCLDPSRQADDLFGSKWRGYEPTVFSSRGYIYVQANIPADLQRTQAGPLAGMPQLAVDAADALIEQGYAEPERIGLFGFSQGGAAVLWIATQTKRFHAVVAADGWSDYWSHYFDAGLNQMMYPERVPFAATAMRYESAVGDFGLGATPWSDPGSFLRNSPLAAADRITSPVLLINSDMDGFAQSQYEHMFAALYRLRREAKMVTYWGEGHFVSSPANLRHCYDTVFQWFDEHLK